MKNAALKNGFLKFKVEFHEDDNFCSTFVEFANMIRNFRGRLSNDFTEQVKEKGVCI